MSEPSPRQSSSEAETRAASSRQARQADEDRHDATTRAAALAPAPETVASGAELPAFDGRYRVLRLLGEGAFGAVYLVEDTLQRDERVALKRFRPRIVEGPGFAQRFHNEIRVLRSLHHEGIPQIYNDGRTQAGELYFTMAYVAGRSLHSLLGELQTLPPGRIARMVRQIVAVLEYAHDRGVVHRDLKPANVMIVGSGPLNERVAVLDFGIAKILRREGPLASAVTMETLGAIGTPHYMSPEQVRGRDIDGATDYYALGVLAYRMIAGRYPFEGESVQELQTARLFDRPIPLPPGIAPPALVALVEALLARDKSERPGSKAVLAALDEALRQTDVFAPDPLEAAPPPRAGIPRSAQVRQARARRAHRGRLALMAVVLVLAGGWWTHRWFTGALAFAEEPSVPAGGTEVALESVGEEPSPEIDKRDQASMPSRIEISYKAKILLLHFDSQAAHEGVDPDALRLVEELLYGPEVSRQPGAGEPEPAAAIDWSPVEGLVASMGGWKKRIEELGRSDDVLAADEELGQIGKELEGSISFLKFLATLCKEADAWKRVREQVELYREGAPAIVREAREQLQRELENAKELAWSEAAGREEREVIPQLTELRKSLDPLLEKVMAARAALEQLQSEVVDLSPPARMAVVALDGELDALRERTAEAEEPAELVAVWEAIGMRAAKLQGCLGDVRRLASEFERVDERAKELEKLPRAYDPRPDPDSGRKGASTRAPARSSRSSITLGDGFFYAIAQGRTDAERARDAHAACAGQVEVEEVESSLGRWSESIDQLEEAWEYARQLGELEQSASEVKPPPSTPKSDASKTRDYEKSAGIKRKHEHYLEAKRVYTEEKAKAETALARAKQSLAYGALEACKSIIGELESAIEAMQATKDYLASPK